MNFLSILPFVLFILGSQDPVEVEVIGVYQGKSLFIQNPYRPTTKSFCVRSIYVNNERQELNYDLSALKLDFEKNDLYTPVTIRIISDDSLCNPIIINPDAIFFHTAYKFTDVTLSEAGLSWTTEGERETGNYIVEKLQNGIWIDIHSEKAKGTFEKAEYAFLPILDEGGNKYRVKYEFGNGKYLISNEADYDHYPEPVTFTPKKTKRMIRFSRAAHYEIFDQNSKLVLSGEGTEVDVSKLWPGDYVIYFDGRDPGIFTKERY